MLAVRRAHRAKSDYAAKGGALWTNGLAVCLAQPKNRRFAVGYVHTHVHEGQRPGRLLRWFV